MRDWPVKTVAARVGYRSVASFSRRFSERYGLDPARIGNA
jgi:transcriptional regulator GlxA family with amidase domain